MKIAVFPGSFDPITNAHIDIIRRALSLFDKVYVAIGVNSVKEPFISYETRRQILEQVFINDKDKIIVDTYTGLTVDYCEKVSAQFILRGIRSVGDFEFEKPIAQNNQVINEKIQTIFLISSPGFSHISSTIVRDIYRNKGDIRKLVPKEIMDFLPET